MQRIIRNLWLLSLALLLTNCSGGSSDSGGGFSPGATRFIGPWTLVATINVNIAGTATFLTQNSEVLVGNDGNVVVTNTNADCTLNIAVSGDVMTYETRCIFPVSTENISTTCTLTLRTQARIFGTPGSASLSGSFGPETLACRGVAAAYSGNLVGNQVDEDDTDTDTDDDPGNDDTET